MSESIYDYERKTTAEGDAKVTFELIFSEISAKMGGDENMVFPKDIMWLCGAPGSGKGEVTQWIMYQRGYHAEPIQISQILQGPEVEELKSSGKLVNDRMVKLRRRYDGTSHFVKFRRPKFHITVLYVDQEISIERQLGRGKRATEHNERVRKMGVGELKTIRETDINPEKAKERYVYFQDHIYASIQSIKEKFPFHFISAEATIDVVKESILKELEYQSSSELGDDTFDMVRQVSLASEIKLDARHKLVTRLDLYATEQYKDLFQQIINVFKYEFEPIVRQQALMGTAIIATENNIFSTNDGIGLTMMLDLLAERGYRVILDVFRNQHPVKVDLKTGEMDFKLKKTFKFHIQFPPPKIRHAMQTYDTEMALIQ